MACLACWLAAADAAAVLSAAWAAQASEAQAAAISREPMERRRRGEVMSVVQRIEKVIASNIIAHRSTACQAAMAARNRYLPLVLPVMWTGLRLFVTLHSAFHFYRRVPSMSLHVFSNKSLLLGMFALLAAQSAMAQSSYPNVVAMGVGQAEASAWYGACMKVANAAPPAADLPPSSAVAGLQR